MKKLNGSVLILLLTININSSVHNISVNDPIFKNLPFKKSEITSAINTIRQRETKFSQDANFEYYKDLASLIKKHDLKIGAEIGVLYAGNSESILQKTKIEKLYSIDPFDPKFFNWSVLAEVMHLKAKKRLNVFKNRSELLRLSSENASKKIRTTFFRFYFHRWRPHV